MYIVLLIIIVIVCVLLGCIVLIQNPKGGGLTSNFSSQSQLMGVQKTGDFLEKGTWVLAITLMVLALMINVVVKNGSTKADSQFDNQVKKSLQAPANSPAAAPTTVPAGAIPPVQQPVKK
ncbi:MAG: preprotein translocase subunit SecG [Mucilaginibacter sp.]